DRGARRKRQDAREQSKHLGRSPPRATSSRAPRRARPRSRRSACDRGSASGPRSVTRAPERAQVDALGEVGRRIGRRRAGELPAMHRRRPPHAAPGGQPYTNRPAGRGGDPIGEGHPARHVVGSTASAASGIAVAPLSVEIRRWALAAGFGAPDVPGPGGGRRRLRANGAGYPRGM
ncbi:MAG: hypothetical protein AVDCRST_MAG17-407, partial [uncultured Solirubrobacterales bacterium]